MAGNSEASIFRGDVSAGRVVEPPRGACQHPIVGIDNVRIAIGQADREVGVQVHRKVAGDEPLVPDVVEVEDADEGRIELGHAAPDRAGLPEIGTEADIAETRVVQLREASPNGLVGSVGRSVVHHDGAEVADGLTGD